MGISQPLAAALSGYVYAASVHERGQRTAADALVAVLGSDVKAIPQYAFWHQHGDVVRAVADAVRARLIILSDKIVPRDASWEDACRLAYAIRIGQLVVSVSAFADNFVPRDRIAPVLLTLSLRSMPASKWLAAARLAHRLRFHRPCVDEDEIDQCVDVFARRLILSAPFSGFTMPLATPWPLCRHARNLMASTGFRARSKRICSKRSVPMPATHAEPACSSQC